MIPWNKDSIKDHPNKQVLVQSESSFFLGIYYEEIDVFKADGGYDLTRDEIDKFLVLEIENDLEQ